MKKLALALVASAVTLSAANANISTGFYLGATAGYGATSGKLTGAGVNGAGAQVAVNGSNDIGGNAANIGIIGGYGWVTGCMYYGGEIGYSFENTKIRDNFNNAANVGTAELKRNGYFNAALRGGYLFTPNTMFYVRLGVNWGKWTFNVPTTPTATLTGSKNRMSFTPGLGLETAIHKNVYLRVEYNYEFGSSVRAKASDNANTFVNAGSIRSQSAKVGLAYKF